MTDDLKNQLRLIAKRIDKLTHENQKKDGYTQRTARLKLLAELVREQADHQEIPLKNLPHNL